MPVPKVLRHLCRSILHTNMFAGDKHHYCLQLPSFSGPLAAAGRNYPSLRWLYGHGARPPLVNLIGSSRDPDKQACLRRNVQGAYKRLMRTSMSTGKARATNPFNIPDQQPELGKADVYLPTPAYLRFPT